jgi:hypothetical protein
MMPQKKASDLAKDATECILRLGKNSNVVQWKEEIQNELTELYGLTAMFFTTNERYAQPFPREEDYILDFPDSDDEKEPPVLFDAGGEPLNPVDIAAQAVAREVAANVRHEVRRRARDKLTLKLREGSFESRRKAMESQRANERTAWGRIWRKMSLPSQSRVRSERRRGFRRGLHDARQREAMGPDKKDPSHSHIRGRRPNEGGQYVGTRDPFRSAETGGTGEHLNFQVAIRQSSES